MFFHRCPAQPRFLPCCGKCGWCTAHHRNPSRRGQPWPQHHLPPSLLQLLQPEGPGEQQSPAVEGHRVSVLQGDSLERTPALSFSPLCPVPAAVGHPWVTGDSWTHCWRDCGDRDAPPVLGASLEHPCPWSIPELLPRAGGTQQGNLGLQNILSARRVRPAARGQRQEANKDKMRLLRALFAVGTAHPTVSLLCQFLGTHQGQTVGLEPARGGGR